MEKGIIIMWYCSIAIWINDKLIYNTSHTQTQIQYHPGKVHVRCVGKDGSSSSAFLAALFLLSCPEVAFQPQTSESMTPDEVSQVYRNGREAFRRGTKSTTRWYETEISRGGEAFPTRKTASRLSAQILPS
jgi:hypothetical protein